MSTDPTRLLYSSEKFTYPNSGQTLFQFPSELEEQRFQTTKVQTAPVSVKSHATSENMEKLWSIGELEQDGVEQSKETFYKERSSKNIKSPRNFPNFKEALEQITEKVQKITDKDKQQCQVLTDHVVYQRDCRKKKKEETAAKPEDFQLLYELIPVKSVKGKSETKKSENLQSMKMSTIRSWKEARESDIFKGRIVESQDLHLSQRPSLMVEKTPAINISSQVQGKNVVENRISLEKDFKEDGEIAKKASPGPKAVSMGNKESFISEINDSESYTGNEHKAIMMENSRLKKEIIIERQTVQINELEDIIYNYLENKGNEAAQSSGLKSTVRKLIDYQKAVERGNFDREVLEGQVEILHKENEKLKEELKSQKEQLSSQMVLSESIVSLKKEQSVNEMARDVHNESKDTIAKMCSLNNELIEEKEALMQRINELEEQVERLGTKYEVIDDNNNSSQIDQQPSQQSRPEINVVVPQKKRFEEVWSPITEETLDLRSPFLADNIDNSVEKTMMSVALKKGFSNNVDILNQGDSKSIWKWDISMAESQIKYFDQPSIEQPNYYATVEASSLEARQASSQTIPNSSNQDSDLSNNKSGMNKNTKSFLANQLM